jgi:20S proteasome subunit alpha 7
VLALEKIVSSKLLKKDANKRIATVDRNIGVVSIGVLQYRESCTSRIADV